MNPYKKLINNSFIFAVGNLGSKLVSFFLVPVYTFYLTTSEFGTIDIVTTTVSMIFPIVSASIFEAVLRFVMDQNEKREEILTNSIIVSIAGFFISFLFFPLFIYINISSKLLLFMYFMLITQVFRHIFAQYTRAIGKTKAFALNGVILALLKGLLAILFLIPLKMGINGYFWSMILSEVISTIHFIFVTKSLKSIKLKNFNFKLSKEMIKYSVPLIPNSLMWWLINASSRYFILFFLGVNANGVFAVASKIPSLVNIMNQVFSQAWQLSAIEEFDNENKTTYYSNVFNFFSSSMLVTTSAIIVVIKLLFRFLFAPEYYSGWIVVPFLLLGAVFSSFSAFLGTNYIAAKNTNGVFKTSVYGGITSLILNLFLIPTFGLIGTGLSSMLSFCGMWLIRLYDTKQYIRMVVNWRLFFFNMLLIFLQIGILSINLSIVIELILVFFVFLVLFYGNRSILIIVINILMDRKKEKK